MNQATEHEKNWLHASWEIEKENDGEQENKEKEREKLIRMRQRQKTHNLDRWSVLCEEARVELVQQQCILWLI